MISLICRTEKTIRMNIYAKQKQTHRYKPKLEVTKGEEGGGHIRGRGLSDTNCDV